MNPKHHRLRFRLVVAMMVVAVGVGLRWFLYGLHQDDSQVILPLPRSNLDVSFVPTPHDVVEKMFELAEVQSSDVVYDLGCGDGRMVVMAAKQFGCQAKGFDLDPECVAMSRANALKEGVTDLVQIEQKNIFDVDLSEADVIMLYLLPELNERLIPQISQMRPGSRIVSHRWEIPGIKTEKSLRMKSSEDDLTHHDIFLWTVPLTKQ